MDIDIPDEISVYDYIKSHIVEINALKKQCRTKQCKNILQRVPRHIRRRAASNNPKRLPKKLQKFIINKTSSTTKLTKCHRRKRKRQIRRRNRDPTRTILHMWFTKRFKMEFMWNIRIPWKNNMKNQRVLYRACKNGSICYYLSYLNIFKLQSNEQLFEQLSNFISINNLEELKNLQFNQTMKINLYEYQKYPYNLIGPCDVIKVKNEDLNNFFLIFIAHRLVYDYIQEQFPKYNNNLSIELMEISCIRLHGPHSLLRLSKRLFNNEKLSIEQDQQQWYCCSLDKKIEKFSKFFDNNNNNDDKIAIREYYFGNQIKTIDLLILNKNLKNIWNRINSNLSHLVGGIRDQEVMTIDNELLFYPKIGYIDCIWNKDSQQQQQYCNHYIIRDKKILNKINEKKSIDDEIYEKIIDPNNVLIMVIIDYKKGTPDINDKIILPKSFDLLLNNNEKIITNDDDNNEQIGHIEYGCFSMYKAHSRAIGYITLNGLDKLFKLNQINQKQQQQQQSSSLLTLIQTKYNHYRIVNISLIINSI